MLDKILSGIFLIYLPVLLQEGSGGFASWVHKNLASLKISLLILAVLLGILLLWEALAFAAARRTTQPKTAGGKEAPRVKASPASDIAPAEDPFKSLMKVKAEEFGPGGEKTTFTPVAVEEVKPELKESISEPARSLKIETPPVMEKIEKKEPERAVFAAKEPEEESDPFKALLKSAASVSEDKVSLPKKEPRTLELPKDSEGADPWKSLLKSAITDEAEEKVRATEKTVEVFPAEEIIEKNEGESQELLRRVAPRNDHQEPATAEKEEAPLEKQEDESMSAAPVSSTGFQPVKEGRKFISLEDIEKDPAKVIENEAQEKPPVKKFGGKVLEIPAREDLAAPGQDEKKKAVPSINEATKKKMLELEGSLKELKDGKEND